ncbi:MULTISPECIES: hypothetical protein [Paenibacillus]|uniref:hypothetical protein n=1 Tax=Paenibacillus TaxID=44249 RepID=UPI000839A827|nr:MULTISPECIES: hypothetical protein [Paenibacillus]GIP23965.1 hypothetical protein J22TS3_42400 [Paenibacillus sp. J22TS3]GIP23966.1 hypothetical protein J22TS3_42410 [Paenibacillus sp. J22TS3]
MAKRPSRSLFKVKGRKLNASKYGRILKPTQRLRRLTIVWADTSGNPYNTTGFFATVSTTSGRLIQRARFDGFGVVVFSRISTPTNRDYIVRTFSSDGTQYREVTVPADNAAFVIIP